MWRQSGASLVALMLALAFVGCATAPAAIAPAIPRTVRDFFDETGWDIAACEGSDLSDLGRYYRHERGYSVDAPVGELWSLYVTVDPRIAWDTPKTRFGIVWDPESGSLFSATDEYIPTFGVGQVYGLELKLAGFYKIPVAFRITRIDIESFSIEFVYLKANKSNGVQRIHFMPAADENGRPYTVVEHRTWYRSDGGFRDERLYGGFHSAIIDAFHRGIVQSGGYDLSVLE